MSLVIFYVSIRLFVDTDKMKGQIASSIESQYKLGFECEKIELNILPIPHFTIQNPILKFDNEELLTNGRIKLDIDLVNLFYSKLSIVSIEFIDSSLNLLVAKRYLYAEKNIGPLDNKVIFSNINFIDLSAISIQNITLFSVNGRYNLLGSYRFQGEEYMLNFLSSNGLEDNLNIEIVGKNLSFKSRSHFIAQQDNKMKMEGQAELFFMGDEESRMIFKTSLKDGIFSIKENESNYLQIDTKEEKTDIFINASINSIKVPLKINSDISDLRDLIFSVLSSKKYKKFLQDNNIIFNLHAKKILLVDDGVFENVHINGDIFEGEICLDKLMFHHKDIELVSSFTTAINKIRPEINGTLYIKIPELNKLVKNSLSEEYSAKKFIAKSDFKITPYKTNFLSIKGFIDDAAFLGNISFEDTIYKPVVVHSNLRFSTLNLDSLNLNQTLSRFIAQLLAQRQNILDLNRYNFLRRPFFELHSYIRMDEMIFNKAKLNNFLINLDLEEGALLINDISFTSDSSSLIGSFHFKIDGLNPIVSSKFYFPKLDPKFLSQLIKVDYNTDIFDIIAYDGSLKLKIDDLTGYDAKSIYVDLITNNNLSKIQKIKADTSMGNIDAIGSLIYRASPDTIQINLAFGLIDAKIHELAKIFSSFPLNKIEGIVNMSGKVSLTGRDFSQFINTAICEAQFISGNIKWNGLDLLSVIKLVEYGNFDGLYSRIDNAFNSGITVFNDVRGKALLSDQILTLENVSIRTDRVAGAISTGYDLKRNLIRSNARFSFIPIGYNIPITIGVQSSGNVSGALVSKLDLSNLDAFIKSSGYSKKS
ncbi:AsmA-like C-terminal region-containing protein [Candidatus Cyrtobacter comes]|nr:AsmA-like C-terminal region-containing protein [Candidatus Cyrtobacter comes]